VTLFILICALLTVAAIASLVWPLLRPAATAEAAPQRANIAATIVAAGLPLIAFAAYFWASDWPWDPAQQSAQPPSGHDLGQMVTQLQQRLSQQPDDLEGWKLLGRSATILGNYPVARDAFSQAYTRSEGQDPDAVVGYAESLVLNDEREIDGQAAELFEKAITMAPDNARALWYGGIVAYRRGELALAQQRWVELQNHDLPPDLRQLVAERLSELEGQPGAPARPQATTAKSSVSVSIQLKSALAGQVPSGATLFLIARRGDAGPPLAVVRRALGSWPVAITMTDADAMMPGTSLASGGPIRLIARISRSGQPVATSGDPYGEVSYDFTATNTVTVTIDRIVP
jgi:cytochrome c-type biogenesis protein CcmH